MSRQTAYRSLMFVGLLFALFPASLAAKVVEQIVVVIDGEPYTLSNLKEYATTKGGRAFPMGDLSRIEKEDKEMLEGFITERLLAAEVKRLGIAVSEGDIDHYITQIRGRNRLSEEDLKSALQREGVTMERYRASVREEIEKGELINSQVQKRVNVTPEDVERYYRTNQKRYMTEDRVRLRHILIALPERATPEEQEAALAKAREVRKRALAGEDFARLARDYSQGAGVTEGGDIGWVSRGSLVSEIEEVAFQRLSVGEISEPLRTNSGIHLIKLEGRERPQPIPQSEVGVKIKEELYAKALEERFQKWLKTDLRKRHHVDVKLPGVVFRPEETKKGTVDSLMAAESQPRRSEQASFWSYLNPLSYIVKQTPIEGEDATGELSGKKIISIFGIPLFTTDTADYGSEELSVPSETDS